mmetsp:Transcript_59441/g.143493  ORF Transcript_59441/g.143493 Transcript_59441/m.143493 type:complete len:209 (+) Transcript_59441:151-777(+)
MIRSRPRWCARVLHRGGHLPGVVLLGAARRRRRAAVADLAAGHRLEGAVVRRAVREEGGALDLLDVVEAGDADEALGEGLGARADLLEDLIGVGAAVHGELPHHPVAVVVVARVDGGVEAGPAVGVAVRLAGTLELDAGSPAVVDEVLDLAGDLLVGEGGEEGEGLEELVVRRVPDLHRGGLGGLAGGDGGDLGHDGRDGAESSHFNV